MAETAGTEHCPRSMVGLSAPLGLHMRAWLAGPAERRSWWATMQRALRHSHCNIEKAGIPKAIAMSLPIKNGLCVEN